MNELRWILVAASVVLLIWIYWQGRRKGLAASDDNKRGNVGPANEPPQLSERVPVRRREVASAVVEKISVDDLPEVRIEPAPAPLSMEAALSTAALEKLTVTQPLGRKPEISPLPKTSPAPVRAAPDLPKPRSARKVIALRVAAGAQPFSGERLRLWFDAHDLRYGKYDIFHRYDERGDTLFSVASMVEPGAFDRHEMESTDYPGVSLFLQLPSVADGVVAFDEMLACAEQLQRDFLGNLCGERNAPLDAELAERMRESVVNFQHLMTTPELRG